MKELKAKTHLTHTRRAWFENAPPNGIEAFKKQTFTIYEDDGSQTERSGRQVMENGELTQYPVGLPINKALDILYKTSKFNVKLDASWEEKGSGKKWAKLIRIHSPKTEIRGICEYQEGLDQLDFFYTSSPAIVVNHSFSYDFIRNESGSDDPDDYQEGTYEDDISIIIGGAGFFFDPSSGRVWLPITVGGFVSSIFGGHPKVNRQLKFQSTVLGVSMKVRFPWQPGWVEEDEWSVSGGGSLTVEQVKKA